MIRYDKAGSTCTGYITQGLRELEAEVTRVFGNIRKQADSVYACRKIRGGKSLSLHAVGRAADIFPRMKSDGDRLAAWLVANASTLNVQEVIWYRRIWSALHPTEGFRAYHGENPHTDHVHVAINLAGAKGGITGSSPSSSDDVSIAGFSPTVLAILVAAGVVVYYVTRK